MNANRIVSALCLVLLGGCFYGLAGAGAWGQPIQKITFDDKVIPPGHGWQCFNATRHREMSTICKRNAQECDMERNAEQGRGAIVGYCNPAPQAHCYYADYDPKKSGALLAMGDRENKMGCFGSLGECSAVSESWRTNGPAGVQGVTDCRTLP
jgi:hypothetical protein